jgi:hypothetical protein
VTIPTMVELRSDGDRLNGMARCPRSRVTIGLGATVPKDGRHPITAALPQCVLRTVFVSRRDKVFDQP